jgi:uncharacterized membrane protein YfcA
MNLTIMNCLKEPLQRAGFEVSILRLFHLATKGTMAVSDLTIYQWGLLLLCGLLIGVAKTGVPGFGILVVPLMAMIFPSRMSTGILLGMLICADVFAAIYYRYSVQWKQLVLLLPGTILGVVMAAMVMKSITDVGLRPIIGVVVLVMLSARHASNLLPSGTRESLDAFKTHWLVSTFFGGMAGFTSMLANAAGPVMTMYLLTLKLDKKRFVGLNAWYFFLLNWIKVPFSAGQDLINKQSLLIDAAAFPAIALGAFFGVWLLNKLPQKAFEIIITLLTAAAAVKLIF